MDTPRRGQRLGVAALALMLTAGTASACLSSSQTPDEDRADATTESPSAESQSGDERAENVIVIVGDGMGIAHRELIRLTTVGHQGELAMEELGYRGWTRTEPADPERAVTDSAAAATALATGVRTETGAVAVDPEGNRLPTLLEQAAEAGKATGVVTTSYVTDATPAAFAAHVPDRDEHGEIARQYLEETNLQVMLGGGAEAWESPPAGNLIDVAEHHGYQYVRDADELEAIDSLPVLGLFEQEEMFVADISEPEYDPAVPLPVMAGKALDLLSQEPAGFFLVIEEEGIDAMAHLGEAETMIEAGRALDETVALASDFAESHGETLLLVVGDHETGGLTIEDIPEGEDVQEGMLTVAGTELGLDVEWTTGGHTAAATPVSAEGPGAERLAEVGHLTDLHELVLAAMALDTP